jgi:hypothetical protein
VNEGRTTGFRRKRPLSNWQIGIFTPEKVEIADDFCGKFAVEWIFSGKFARFLCFEEDSII